MKTHLNLLPWNCRQTRVLRARLRQWSLPWGAALGAVLVVLVIQWNRCQAVRERMEQLETQYAPVENLREAIKGLRTKLGVLEQQDRLLAQLEPTRPALTLFGLISQSARECQGQLRVEQVLLQPPAEGEKNAKPENQPPKPVLSATATIKGIATDNLSVARFVVALRQTRAFERVDLKASEENQTDGRPFRSFTVECAY